MLRIRNLRWMIAALLLVATALSFLDRQVLSVAILKIKTDFNISDVEYGWINTAFLISYAIMFSVGGWLIDRFGTRIGLAVSVGLWSVASAMHGAVQNITQMGIARFFLGFGEGGCFPGASKGITEWFPKKERATAMGIAIGGSALGAVLAPPLTVYLVSVLGWRGAFIITGSIGMAWVIIWLLIFNKPSQSKLITEEELGIISQDESDEAESLNQKAVKVPISKILSSRQAWTLIAIRFMLDPVFYFFMFWIPKYLNAERNVSFERVGELLWIPFFALGLSNMFGGWVSDKLIRSGVSTDKARKSVMGAAALLTMTAPLTATVQTVGMAVFFMSLIMLAHGFWITNYITITSELFGKNATSTVVGMAGSAGAVAGLIINPLIGVIVQNYSYLPLWIASGVLYPLAFILLIIFIKNIRPVLI
ncbi:MAG TPA: MFS transporter [Bacteroidales bacterium]|nr:MFS transporter [Bacteroidales bacterium]